MKDPQHPRSHHPDNQPANISHGDGLHHHGVHPSVERAFNRNEAPVPVTHHSAERTVEEHMAETQREHAERKERHERRR
jgi:hypothetical protein